MNTLHHTEQASRPLSHASSAGRKPASAFVRLGVVFALLLSALMSSCPAAQSLTTGRVSKVRLMIVIPEEINGVQMPEPASETELIRLFAAAKYRVVDQQEYASKRYTPDMDRILQNPGGPQARSLTANSAAGILIVGRATSSPGAYTNDGFRHARAEISAKAISIDDCEILASTHQTASGADTSYEVAARLALRNAGAACVDELMAAVGEAVGGPTTPPGVPQSEGPHKPRLGIMAFTDASGWSCGGYQLSVQVPHLVAQELQKLGQYEIIEMTESDNLKRVQASLQDGTYAGANGRDGEAGTLKRPDYLVKGRIIQFSTKQQSLGGGGGGGVLGRLGIRLPKVLDEVKSETAQVSLEIEVVDVRTGEVVLSTEASASDTQPVFAGLADTVWQMTNKDCSAAAKATRTAVTKAVSAVAATVTGQVGQAESVTCPKCHATLKPGAKFCDQCSAKVQSGPRTCAKCGAQVSANAKFCSECSAPVGS